MKCTERNIVLIGMPGSGKSVIGRRVSKKLKLDFYDMDNYIEKKEGRSIGDIFKDGEGVFREIEKAAVLELSRLKGAVISTGGGVVLNECNIKALKENGIIFFVNRPVANILTDVNISKRPLLKNGREQVVKLYNERIGLYKKYCDFEVLNSGSIEKAVAGIIIKWERCI